MNNRLFTAMEERTFVNPWTNAYDTYYWETKIEMMKNFKNPYSENLVTKSDIESNRGLILLKEEKKIGNQDNQNHRSKKIVFPDALNK
jgi:hypothetical protein